MLGIILLDMSDGKINLEKYYKGLTTLGKARLIMGAVCFVIVISLVVVYLGFSFNQGHMASKSTITAKQLWIATIVLGALGGVLFTGKRFLLSAVAGVVSSLSITYTALLYMGWRIEIYKIELIIPLFAAFTGVFLYQMVARDKK